MECRHEDRYVLPADREGPAAVHYPSVWFLLLQFLCIMTDLSCYFPPGLATKFYSSHQLVPSHLLFSSLLIDVALVLLFRCHWCFH